MGTFGQLGKLEKVAIREVWQGEARDFTPWLSRDENLSVLGSAIGIDLELVNTEVQVGDYRLDILAQHEGTQEAIVIENQFGKTDHAHLGQLMTYAAGVGADGSGAKTIIWIAEQFAEPHRSALDWLNNCTEPGIGFFGVEIELWRIGTSMPAPKFNLVSKPNNWQKAVTRQTSTGLVNDQLYLDFWSSFIEYCQQAGTTLRFPSPWGRHWLPITIGRSNFIISLTVSKKEDRIGCELYMSGSRAKIAFRLLSQEKSAIGSALGAEIEFEELPTRMASRIVHYSNGDVNDRLAWPTLHHWLKSRAEDFVTVFRGRVKGLNLGASEDADEG